ncbi:hypothetical protein GW933_03300 [Candidatus Falkowbacteria bacterium]|uniref:Uncharacterized protein n=1 Tax=Candidatus Buchananbacteria bacterium CG10_big_fil_rev_8_21_14_0_10_33_19 TaxID=1974525 RepID=A0A2H0W4X1_9BACT|nr:hypothetical protein [Candidatus Falkowbacteria bacterium]PIS06327.1 MAG: hypothetical protein COT80_02045 [Candidatus Buchananbacteria bacterium CG10_big_fil_rev_8_21_14_0_10_33_19]
MSNKERQELTNSKWCNPRSNQISVTNWPVARKVQIEVPEFKLLGFRLIPAHTKVKTEYVEISKDEVPDSKKVWREFKHRCGLIKAIYIVGAESSKAILLFDGYRNETVPISKIRINVLSESDSQLDDTPSPIAEICFTGFGERYGGLTMYEVNSITLWFHNNEELRSHLVAMTRPVDEISEKLKDCQRQMVEASQVNNNSFWPFIGGLALGVAILD